MGSTFQGVESRLAGGVSNPVFLAALDGVSWLKGNVSQSEDAVSGRVAELSFPDSLDVISWLVEDVPGAGFTETKIIY